jgi:Zn finger protein HypA/HybF involved in hydrogenase expression
MATRGGKMIVKTDPNYWDCECKDNFIHLKANNLSCSVCRMTEDECSDSRPNEIKLYYKNYKENENDEYGEVYDKNGDEITSWNTEDHVVCPNCKSFDYYILKENEDE